MKTIGEYLKLCREVESVTQRELSEFLGLRSPQYISNVERGLCLPTLASLGSWCEKVKANKNTVTKALMSDYRIKVREGLGL